MNKRILIRRGLWLAFGLLLIALISLLAAPTTSAVSPTYSRTYTTNADFDEGTLVGVEHDTVADQLQLSGEVTTYPIMWIANAGEDTLSKWNTDSNTELARYHTWFGPPGSHDAWSGPSPSRTAVDLKGNCYVANRHFDSRPADVIKILADDWIDRNGNGVLDTSYDANSDGTIDPSEMLPMTDSNFNGIIDDSEIQDERVAWAVSVGPVNGLGRSLAIDLDGNIWLGLFNARAYYKLSGDDGSVLAGPISVAPNTPYGALVDRHGILWGASLSTNLLRLDTNTHAVTVLDHSAYGGDYGIALGYGAAGDTHVYQASTSGKSYIEYDSGTGLFSTPAALWFVAYGIAVDSNGDIFVSNTFNGSLAKFAPGGGLIYTSAAQVTSEARGTVVDSDDNAWIIHRAASRLSKFQGSDGAALGVFNTGLYPYTYSDATGLGLRSAITAFGTWNVVFDSGVLGAPWGTISWNSDEPVGTTVAVRARSSTDQVSWSAWESVANGVALTSTPNGQYLQVEAALQISSGDVSPVLYDLTIAVANQPPLADANGPYAVEEDTALSLDGSGSSDPDGDPLTFNWDLDGDGEYDDASGATPAHTFDTPGIYIIGLEVCDGMACDTDETTVTVTLAPGLFPPEINAEKYRGECVTETKTVNVPPRPPNADVVFAFDLTGSMSGIINTAKSRATDIMSALDAIPGVSTQYGVMSYMDYPNTYSSCGYSAPYGSSYCGDYAYALDQAVTNDTGAVSAAISGLTLGCGGDGPQDYTRIFYESYADSTVAWRSGAKRILLNFGDNVPHDCDLNEGVPGKTGDWTTGCDPGRDEVANTPDDLDLQSVLADMDSEGVVLLEAHTSMYANEYWTYWTGLTDGDVFITGSGTMVDDVVGAITSALEAGMVYGLHLEAESPFEAWLTTDPAYLDVDPGDVGVSVEFDATFTVPPGTPPGTYTFTVYAVDEDGVVYGEQQVTIIVLPPSMVTDSGLCTFDRAPEIEGDQFRLIFTPDMQEWPAFKLPASNPGQFYYNVFYAGAGPVNLDITIPDPFVGQGTNWVHVYGGREVEAFDDTICFHPDYDSEIYAGDLGGLPDDLPGGFIYVAIHLDYGLKGSTGYVQNYNDDALDADTEEVVIPNLHPYVFAVTGSQEDSQIIYNQNAFKRIPGIGGLVMDGDTPVKDVTVTIYGPGGSAMATLTTDEDGWYMFEYKHLGKPAEFRVVLPVFGESQTFKLKANQFVEVSFDIGD